MGLAFAYAKVLFLMAGAAHDFWHRDVAFRCSLLEPKYRRANDSVVNGEPGAEQDVNDLTGGLPKRLASRLLTTLCDALVGATLREL
jgi:hypothetical protein